MLIKHIKRSDTDLKKKKGEREKNNNMVTVWKKKDKTKFCFHYYNKSFVAAIEVSTAFSIWIFHFTKIKTRKLEYVFFSIPKDTL